MIRTRLENYMQRKISLKPEGNLFLRFLMRFYDIIYLRKDYREYTRHLSRQIPE